jgi:hypothetical protein
VAGVGGRGVNRILTIHCYRSFAGGESLIPLADDPLADDPLADDRFAIEKRVRFDTICDECPHLHVVKPDENGMGHLT